MNCGYSGKEGGGQFRILANAASSSEAEASAKRMQDRQEKGKHNPGLSAVDSQGTVVFSIALFQKEPTADSASQLKKLVAAAKQNLAK
jgi:GGDEF domain-containing protein